MSFYFQKRIKIGPINLNFSKSGLGTSIGIKGARIGSGPRGKYVHFGGSGIYFKKYLSTQKKESVLGSMDVPQNDQEIFNDQSDSSSDPVVQILNSHRAKIAFSLIVIFVLVLFLSARFSYGIYENYKLYNSQDAKLKQQKTKSTTGNTFSLESVSINLIREIVLSFVAFIILLPITIFLDYQRKRANINFDTPEQLLENYLRPLEAILDNIASTQLVEILVSQEQHSAEERKYHAGAANTLDLQIVKLHRRYPDYTRFKEKPYCLEFSGFRLFFLPHLFLLENPSDGFYYSYPLKDAAISLSTKRIIWSSPVPRDSEIVDYTYKYLNKNGGPDKRFANNFQIPILKLAVFELTLQEENQLTLYISDSKVFEESNSDAIKINDCLTDIQVAAINNSKEG